MKTETSEKAVAFYKRYREWLDHPIHKRTAETRDGDQVLAEACELAWFYPHLSDGELIVLAYWGAV